jgi:septal ring factor EnvC (AmiA/AmiB activator)
VFKKRLIAALTISVFSLTACVETMGPENAANLTAEEQQIRQIERDRLQQSALVGCAAGAVLGVLASANSSNRGRDIAVATLAGCAAGFAFGAYVNARTQQFSSSQQQSQALISAADQDIRRYDSLNRTASRLVESQRQKVASLNRQLSSGQITADAYRAQVASAGRNLSILQNQERAIADQITTMRRDVASVQAGGGNAAGLNQRIARLEQERNELAAKRNDLARVYRTVPAEVGLNL